jgi:GT2 family glycosyltransferase
MPPVAPTIYAVIVLFNQNATDSPAVQAFAAALAMDADFAGEFRLLLYDNSPDAQAVTPTCEYHHDPTNQGLAAAYNYALARAAAEQCAWLLLLDQDTQVTREYLEEVVTLTRELAANLRVSAIVPKLRSDKGIKSPTLDFLEWLRRQFQFPRRRALFATAETYGLQEEQFSAFNSASVLRVESLQKIGGFPKAFWLDFLDVAVFNALHTSGTRLFVMHATLLHELSLDTKRFYEKDGSLARYQNFLSAMVRFVRVYGRPGDLWLARFWLFKNAFILLRTSKDRRFSSASFKQALLLRG